MPVQVITVEGVTFEIDHLLNILAVVAVGYWYDWLIFASSLMLVVNQRRVLLLRLHHKLTLIILMFLSCFTLNCDKPASCVVVRLRYKFILYDLMTYLIIIDRILGHQFAIADIFIIIIKVVLCFEILVVDILHLRLSDFLAIIRIIFGHSDHPDRYDKHDSKHDKQIDPHHKQISTRSLLINQHHSASQRYSI